jgi:hypothetical protein
MDHLDTTALVRDMNTHCCERYLRHKVVCLQAVRPTSMVTIITSERSLSLSIASFQESVLRSQGPAVIATARLQRCRTANEHGNPVLDARKFT